MPSLTLELELFATHPEKNQRQTVSIDYFPSIGLVTSLSVNMPKRPTTTEGCSAAATSAQAGSNSYSFFSQISIAE